jgi:uncharacterized membrane protein YraQ (UPF0718 family)/copper chaperone CopZ
MDYLIGFLAAFFNLLTEMAPWLLIGFFFAGLLHVYMPKEKITRFMGRQNLKSVINAAILGIPLPLCSCGVIPTGIAFHKEGASKGATVSFLISTPQTGVDSILVTYSMLGLPFALIRPVVAFFSGIFGGSITNLIDRKNKTEKTETVNVRAELYEGGKKGRIKSMFRYAFYEFLMDIAKWLIIGLAIASLIEMILPDDFFTMYIGNEFLSMGVVLLAAIPVYVCATGSVPIAAVLMMKGLSPGAALVFLMAGPATNTATMAVIGKAIDKRTLIVYLTTIIVSAFFFGSITNLLPREWFAFAQQSMEYNHIHHIFPEWVNTVSGIILILLIINVYVMKFFKKKNKIEIDKGNSDLQNIMKLSVTGMTCNHCKANVEKNLINLEGIDYVNADPQSSEVILKGDNIDLARVKDVVESIGYGYKGKLDK